MRRLALVLLLIPAALVSFVLVHAQAPNPTATPIQINLSPVAPAQVQDNSNPGLPTPTWTQTPPGVAILEAKDFANVRADPSTDSAQLGTIHAGEKYNVIGRYVSWIEFQFNSSPTGKGWVFGDLVNLTGNLDNIPNIDPYADGSAGAGIDPNAANSTATQSILTQTPGGVLTATAISQLLAPAGTSVAATDSGTREIEPTFTFPPGMVAIAPTQGAPLPTDPATGQTPLTSPDDGNVVPPIVPILVLGGLGILGLAVSALRRGN